MVTIFKRIAGLVLCAAFGVIGAVGYQYLHEDPLNHRKATDIRAGEPPSNPPVPLEEIATTLKREEFVFPPLPEQEQVSLSPALPEAEPPSEETALPEAPGMASVVPPPIPSAPLPYSVFAGPPPKAMFAPGVGCRGVVFIENQGQLEGFGLVGNAATMQYHLPYCPYALWLDPRIRESLRNRAGLADRSTRSEPVS
jgi:predicted outer membrane lipoprotein